MFLRGPLYRCWGTIPRSLEPVRKRIGGGGGLGGRRAAWRQRHGVLGGGRALLATVDIAGRS